MIDFEKYKTEIINACNNIDEYSTFLEKYEACGILEEIEQEIENNGGNIIKFRLTEKLIKIIIKDCNEGTEETFNINYF